MSELKEVPEMKEVNESVLSGVSGGIEIQPGIRLPDQAAIEIAYPDLNGGENFAWPVIETKQEADIH